RSLALRDPRDDGELACERDAHDVPARYRDDAPVERGGGVVGVALELGGGAQRLGARLPRAGPCLGGGREQAGDARGGRVAEAAPAREARPYAQRAASAGVAEGAHRGMVLRRGFLAAGEHFEVHIERDRDRIECRPDVGRRRGNPNAPAALHVGQPRASASYAVRLPPNLITPHVPSRDMNPRREGGFAKRQCARFGCSAPAIATFTFDSGARTVWLDIPAVGAARAGELCERHTCVLKPPRGWQLVD